MALDSIKPHSPIKWYLPFSKEPGNHTYKGYYCRKGRLDEAKAWEEYGRKNPCRRLLKMYVFIADSRWRTEYNKRYPKIEPIICGPRILVPKKPGYKDPEPFTGEYPKPRKIKL